ncbi:MAG: PAS domain-containing protein [Candidatus Competibacteraceae bacterium]|nr:PAS domain-containing protein [Candidatus Competibacteraceae bacterium]
MTWKPLLIFPARWLVPLLLVLLALMGTVVIYIFQVHEYREDVGLREQRRLLERMAVEQTRLEVQLGQGNRLQARRLVSGLGLYSGVTHAWLTDGEGRIEAALSRLQVGRPLAEILVDESPSLRQAIHHTLDHQEMAVHMHPMPDEEALLGHVAMINDYHLLLRVDLAQPLAERLYAGRGEIWREAGIILLSAVLLAILLHLLWFHRVAQLTATAAALGAGRMEARAGLAGRDELAAIGAAVDRMAEELQQRQAQLRQLASLIDHSPVIAIAWRNEPGWPVSFVSDNVAEWGYAPEEFRSGSLIYADLIHPEDRPRVEAEVAEHFTRGPDDYLQEYRLRRADGQWLWIEDRTWLTRAADGTVVHGEGVLLDVSERRRLRDVERQSEERLQLALRAANQGLYDLDIATGEAVVNTEYATMLGYDPATFRETHLAWIDRLHPDDTARVGQTFRDYVAHRIPDYQVEFRQRTAAGDWKWILSLGKVVLWDADGHPLRMLGTHTDIDERKRVEEALVASEARYREAERVAKVGGWELHLLDNQLWWSEEIFRIFEIDSERFEASYEAFLALVHPEDRERVDEAYQTSVANHEPYQIVHRLLFADGRVKYVRERGETEYADDGHPLRSLGTVQDVTEQVLAEKQVRESEERYRTLVELLPYGVQESDATGRIVFANPALGRLQHGAPEQSIGAMIWDFADDESERESLRDYSSYLIAEQPPPTTYYAVNRRGDGQLIDVQVDWTYLRNADGSPRGFLSVVSDVTERKRLETEIRRANAELEERVRQRTTELATANQELETFTYSVSHDLKAPLRGIDGYSQLLLTDYGDRLDEEGRFFLKNVRQGVAQMSQLIEDLLAYSRMERRSLEQIALDLEETVARILTERKSDLEDRQAQVEVAVRGLTAQADPDGLALVLRNLIDNALKFTRDRQPPVLRIFGRSSDQSTVILSVKDNGIGFDMRFHDRIFEIFQRLQRAEDYPGTGVGLAIVRKAARRMGGRVWAESAPGQGATFYLELPR